MTKLLCALLGHKWTPAEATNDPGLELVCQRCGRMRSFEEGTTVRERRRRDDMPSGGAGPPGGH